MLLSGIAKKIQRELLGSTLFKDIFLIKLLAFVGAINVLSAGLVLLATPYITSVAGFEGFAIAIFVAALCGVFGYGALRFSFYLFKNTPR